MNAEHTPVYYTRIHRYQVRPNIMLFFRIMK